VTAYAADAHAIIWYLEDNPKLSAIAAAVLEQPDVVLFVSVITAAELWLIVEKGRSTITPEELKEFFARESNLRVVPLTYDDVVAAKALKELTGLHDRFIVTCAKALERIDASQGLITGDAEIHACKLVTVIW